MKRGQMFSLDAIVGVFLFTIIVLGVVLFSVSKSHMDRMEGLKDEGEKIYEWLASSESGGIISQKKVDSEKIEDITNLTYDQLKRKLGIASDFCIYFVDEEGNLVYINATNPDSVGIGSPKVTINGKSCSG